MLYSEFVEGTGCKENDHNYKVYKDLEILYMNSDLTKQDIYEYGKKLVDNSKTEKEVEFETGLRNKMKELKQEYQRRMNLAKTYSSYYKEDKDIYWKNQSKWQKEIARNIRNEISGIKFVLGI